jgi:hypothetical protein
MRAKHVLVEESGVHEVGGPGEAEQPAEARAMRSLRRHRSDELFTRGITRKRLMLPDRFVPNGCGRRKESQI